MRGRTRPNITDLPPAPGAAPTRRRGRWHPARAAALQPQVVSNQQAHDRLLTLARCIGPAAQSCTHYNKEEGGDKLARQTAGEGGRQRNCAARARFSRSESITATRPEAYFAISRYCRPAAVFMLSISMKSSPPAVSTRARAIAPHPVESAFCTGRLGRPHLPTEDKTPCLSPFAQPTLELALEQHAHLRHHGANALAGPDDRGLDALHPWRLGNGVLRHV